MNRMDVLKLGAISSAAAFTGGAMLGESTAWAMNPRFDLTLKLRPGGLVNAAGPTNFASDEKLASVWAHVAQGDRVQSGQTGWFLASSDKWFAHLLGPSLKPGPADAYGVAYVENRDGTYEWYPWQVAVTLR